MDKECVMNFIKIATQDRAVIESDNRIKEMMDNYEVDKPDKGKEGFCRFYKEKTQKRAELVWVNLGNFGFEGNLKPKGLGDGEDESEVQSKAVLPRHKLSFDQEKFDTLFELLDQHKYDDLWALLNLLRTNPRMFFSVLYKRDLQSSLQSKSLYRVLYALQIVEHLIGNYQSKHPEILRKYLEVTQTDQKVGNV